MKFLLFYLREIEVSVFRCRGFTIRDENALFQTSGIECSSKMAFLGGLVFKMLQA
ncbi:hypothetical protein OQ279_14445 [Salinimicrobium sp. MT39]|uniref:Uncharacterized protein n=1 Tax=Salinimicrobium profundisediminis TaxID=2994553 RepID=A0A9X3CYT3_9FLAO|nr:hypothetical protein [Salinimicrobium profundisediminis]MCX2839351.1 hypothetical protein [Salinimicrobium profundisediminis]